MGKKTKRWLWIGGGGACLLWLMGILPAQAETAGMKRLAELCEALQTSTSAQSSPSLQALDILTLAEASETCGQTETADQYRLYVKKFFPGLSAAVPSLAGIPEDTAELSAVEVDPDVLRLIRSGCRSLRQQGSGFYSREGADWWELVQAFSAAPDELPSLRVLQDFLNRHPESSWAGWAAYQLIWQNRFEQPESQSAELFQQFWSEHKDHPLGAEAPEALDVTWFSPRRLAQLSALFPGWGESLLEPGMHESAQPFFAEVLYWIGTISFYSAAQSRSRTGNLTGALIFANFLILNHRGSSDMAFVSALRRNWAQRRKFIFERIGQPVAGPGRFDHPTWYQPADLPSLANDAVVSLVYRSRSAGDAFRGRGLIRDEQLANLGIKAEWLFGLADWMPVPGWAIGLGLAPGGRFFSTQAEANPEAKLASGLELADWYVGCEAALLLKWDWGGSWLLGRLSAGPAYRQRHLALSGSSWNDQGLVSVSTASLAMGGLSGSYWQVGVTWDDGRQSQTFLHNGQTYDVPSSGLDFFFGLGVYF